MSQHQSFTSEMLLKRFSHQPWYILNNMITVSVPINRTTVHPRRKRSTLGVLDDLPLEILHMVLSMLDLQSFSRLSQTCSKAYAVTQSFPLYRNLIKHAPHAVAALTETRLDRHHTIAMVHAALLSEQCVSCGHYGAFLFLISCERCCYECLRRNRSCWVIPASLAAKCFNLNADQLREVPHLLSVPGRYSSGGMKFRKRRINLVGVGSAKTVALRIHGSMENMTRDPLISERGDTLAPKEFRDWRKSMSDKEVERMNSFRWFQKTPLQPLDHDPVLLPSKANTPTDNYSGMASIFFPSLLLNGSVETGLWCRECEYTYKLYDSRHRQDTTTALADKIASVRDPREVFYGLQNRALSKTAFLEHVEHCYGVQRMLSES